ncbi:KdsC family phosphatase [Sphingobacterium corticibacterium]|uniref:3-deoxy-D-manno-octulosonate 8-phosphate phosphatase KdsC n=1 Tax=Sphingobacterium corticibacterium TaxID=2484746 RepID=A0A4Q6XQB4_9SPHI|nr:HAD-IIIA family hydrolase [Sphingobacterium corticibacterium]RZF59612.1 HAD-IIIA family hydrolase [Sphingobacterium corticibacterium]
MVLQAFANIKVLFLDVDGVLTDGSVLVTEQGEQLRRFSIKDGYAIQLAMKRGLRIAVISGGKSQGVLQRLRGLGVEDVFLGVGDKLTVMRDIILRYKVALTEVAFMGDDIPDLTCLKQVGLPMCPQDAVEEIKAVAHYVSPKNGGEGCVRDVIEKILKLQKKWYDNDHVKSI